MADENAFVDPDTGNIYRVGGCIVSDAASDLPKFGASRTLANKDLPHSVDLRVLMTPVEDQGSTNSWLVSE